MESVMAAIHWLATREQAGERLIISLADFEETKYVWGQGKSPLPHRSKRYLCKTETSSTTIGINLAEWKSSKFVPAD
jgi:hypothetical protein